MGSGQRKGSGLSGNSTVMLQPGEEGRRFVRVTVCGPLGLHERHWALSEPLPAGQSGLGVGNLGLGMLWALRSHGCKPPF